MLARPLEEAIRGGPALWQPRRRARHSKLGRFGERLAAAPGGLGELREAWALVGTSVLGADGGQFTRGLGEEGAGTCGAIRGRGECAMDILGDRIMGLRRSPVGRCCAAAARGAAVRATSLRRATLRPPNRRERSASARGT